MNNKPSNQKLYVRLPMINNDIITDDLVSITAEELNYLELTLLTSERVRSYVIPENPEMYSKLQKAINQMKRSFHTKEEAAGFLRLNQFHDLKKDTDGALDAVLTDFFNAFSNSTEIVKRNYSCSFSEFQNAIGNAHKDANNTNANELKRVLGAAFLNHEFLGEHFLTTNKSK